MEPPRALIYSGAQRSSFVGVNFDSLNNLESKIKSDFQVERVHPETIDSKLAGAKLIVFPGGRCSAWDLHITQTTLEKIKQFVQEGGMALMICAGAYYSAEKSTFITESESLIKERNLKFFKGQAIGPVTIDSTVPRCMETNPEIVNIQWIKDSTSGYVYLNQGGHFIPNETSVEGRDYRVLAKYENGLIAIIECIVGEGFARLSFVHFEYDTLPVEGLSKFHPEHEPYWRKCQENLDSSIEFRAKCLRELTQLATSTL